MIDALYISESGLSSQQTLIDVISNNIANTNTPAFKKNSVNFVDLVYKDATAPEVSGSDLSPNTLIGAGASIATTSKVFTPGELQPTQNPMDLAISGNGFLEVTLDNGDQAYTRAGRIKLDNEGYITSSAGHRLSSNIQVSPDVERLEILPNGIVNGYVANSTEIVELGQIELARFNNQEQLLALGDNLFKSTAASGEANLVAPGTEGAGSVMQGYTENSNVEMTAEMVNLISAQRVFQMNARVFQVCDQILEVITSLRS